MADLPAVQYIIPGYILVRRKASLLFLTDVAATKIFWTPKIIMNKDEENV